MIKDFTTKVVGPNTIITGNCVGNGKSYSVTVPTSELLVYMAGSKLIQHAMPSVSRDDREFLISGYSPEGWKEVMSLGD